MDSLKHCPFCGNLLDIEHDAGTVFNPDSYWDSGMRGEEYGFVLCRNCGVILKADSLKAAINRWNQRKRAKFKPNMNSNSVTAVGPIEMMMESTLQCGG